MSTRWGKLAGSLLRGALAALIWLAGFVAAFPVWRLTFALGVFLLTVVVGAGAGLVLHRKGGADCGAAFVMAAALCVLLLPPLWSMPWFNEMLLALYRGLHVTEAGFAGLFTILLYVPVSILLTLLTRSLPYKRKSPPQRRN